MFCQNKNSYLQLVCAVNPRVINKAVDQAMSNRLKDPHDESPGIERLTSMHPSLFAPHVDISRARLGFERIGLRIINRELHSEDSLIQLQALHTILDQVQISENAMFLINLNVIYRLMDLLRHRDPVIKEKVCMTLSHLATYYQGRKRIMSRPQIIDDLMWLFTRDRKEIRYAAAFTLKTLAKNRCASEVICQNPKIIETLLKTVKNDHTGIILLHLQTLANLIEWDQTVPLKLNAFQIMLVHFKDKDPRIVAKAMDCMAQLLKHDVGKKLADNNDLIYVLKPYLYNSDIEVVISAVGVLLYSTITTRSKWRAKECCNEMTSQLVKLCSKPNTPLLQMRCMRVLINLCDCPDIRNHVKKHWEKEIIDMKIRNHEEWDGGSETTSYGLETGHNYRTRCIEKTETIRNDYGDNAEVVNTHSYLGRVKQVKDQLVCAMNWKSYRN